MNRSKLTPCRKVGLSRKKNTPLKTVESLLTKNENCDNVSSTPKTAEKTTDLKPFPRNEVNSDTPCRQVGLSRKRKVSTPLGFFEKEKNIRTPSSIKGKTTKLDDESNHTEAYAEKKKISLKNDEPQDDNHASCAKKLSNLFSSPSGAKTKQKANNLPNTEHIEKIKRSGNDQEKVSCSNNISFKFAHLHNGEEIENNGNSSKYVVDDKPLVNEFEKCITQPCDSEKLTVENSTQITSTNKNLTQSHTQFIKVCYSNEKENKQSQDKVLKPDDEKKMKFSDDDDFEIGPKKKKPKKLLERSKTYVEKKVKKSTKNELKKSLSVGDSGSRTLTDSSITSKTSSLDLLNDCFVKLEKIKDLTDKQNFTPQENIQSDDDFEAPSCTPKETKIKNLDSLEKEVKEKRQILEDLERAKVYKRMHSIEDLKELTSRWKNGCVDAIQDLLKQLNMHSHMDMAMLLKKLNIPEDFIPSSQ